MDLEMCRAQILSNDYRDFIVSMDGGRISLPALPEEVCSQEVGAGYEIVYPFNSLTTYLASETASLTFLALLYIYAPIGIPALFAFEAYSLNLLSVK